jgi:hypothetical protein
MRILTLVLAALTFSVPGFAQTGNLAPSGPHFELNIIGVPQDKTADMTNSDRHTIFVALGSKDVAVRSYIWLTQGSFAVCDGNAFTTAYDCNGIPLGGNKVGAVFQLPCNTGITVLDPCISGDMMIYTVWARALGIPGGKVTVTTCAFDKTTNATVCSSENEMTMRYKGKQTFQDVTSALTTLQGVVLPGGAVGSADLFAPGFMDFFWQYDNQGLKLLQVRLYPTP